jgi:hypothetical protein
VTDYVAAHGKVHKDADGYKVLVDVLLHCFVAHKFVFHSPYHQLKEIGNQIAKMYGGERRNIVLHVDEFDSDVELAYKLLIMCMGTLGNDYGVCVVPILSGANYYAKLAQPIEPGSWSRYDIELTQNPLRCKGQKEPERVRDQ